MNCEKYKELINKYIDNDIEEKELEYLSSHLEVCEDCRILLYDLQNLTELSNYLIYKRSSNKKRFIKSFFIKTLLMLFLILSFKFLPFSLKNNNVNIVEKKEDKKPFVKEENDRRIYLIDFEFSGNMVLR